MALLRDVVVRTELFGFELPDHLIALEPAEPRDSARMLLVDGAAPDHPGAVADHRVADLPSILRRGDILVLNDTRVIPAALDGVRERAGNLARVSFNLTRKLDQCTWRAFARPAKRLDVGDLVRFGKAGPVGPSRALEARVAERLEAGEVVLAFNLAGAQLDEAFRATGDVPLPPYIALKRGTTTADRDTYQTIYAARDGAVAAPTAGLHFTPELFARLEAAGIERAFVTLHVGAGTFLPVKAEDTREHTMHSEWAEIDAATADRLDTARRGGRRIVAVGTTSMRVLESATGPDGVIRAYGGETDIFITPGYRFRAVDILMTNFHLPRSTLFMLVSAFSGLDRMRAAYEHAIASGYRFYSYGDACLLYRAPD